MGVIDLFTKRSLWPEPTPSADLRWVDRFFGSTVQPQALVPSRIAQPPLPLPLPFRVQAVQLLEDAIGGFKAYQEPHRPTREISQWVVERLCREYGVFRLSTGLESLERHYLHELTHFITQERQPLRVLDAIELVFRARWDPSLGGVSGLAAPSTVTRDAAQDELNTRFVEHGLPYRMVQCHIVDIGASHPARGQGWGVDASPVTALVASLTGALKGLQAPGHELAHRDLSQALRAQRSGQHPQALRLAAGALAEAIRVSAQTLGLPPGDALSTAEALQRAGRVDPVWVQLCRPWLTMPPDNGASDHSAASPGLVTLGLHSITAALVYLLDSQQGAG